MSGRKYFFGFLKDIVIEEPALTQAIGRGFSDIKCFINPRFSGKESSSDNLIPNNDLT